MSIDARHTNRDAKPVNRICAGIDVHRDFACVSILERRVDEDHYLDYQRYDTTSDKMQEMRKWLQSNQVSTVGVESTGKYWYSIFNALEGYFTIKIYNARHIKNIPGKKTDKSDSMWIAKVTMDETIKPSFIPDAQIRDARTLSRYRKSLINNRTRVRQQTHGLLENAGIKISRYVSDLFGTSGINLLKIIANDEPYNELIIEKKVRNQIKKKVPQLMIALQGNIRPLQRDVLKLLIESNNSFTSNVQDVENRLRRLLLDTDHKTEIYNAIRALPGFSDVSALILLSEIGFDLSSFPTVKHFSSWAGLSPGSHESAGKNKSGKIQNRQKYLRSLMIEIALIAVVRRDSFLRAKYFALKSRIGANKAVIAIAHKLIMAVYRVIHDNKQYTELGADYVSLSQMTKDKLTLARITKRLGTEVVSALVEQISSEDIQ